ncbi:hypothetical protein ABE10_12275 [Bacillus toyonensis]|nr:hypothetical protein [Bacillus toyonensis]
MTVPYRLVADYDDHGGEHDHDDADRDVRSCGDERDRGDERDDRSDGKADVQRVDLTEQHPVEEEQGGEEDPHRDHQCEKRRGVVDRGSALDRVGRHVEPRTGGGDRGEEEDVAVSPEESPLSVGGQHLGGRHGEVQPPERERERRPAERDRAGFPAPPLLLDDRGDRDDGAQHHFSQRDDDQQAVSLGDMVRMPGRVAADALRDHRHEHLEDRGDRAQAHHHRDRRVDEDEDDPVDLRDRDQQRVEACRRPMRRVVVSDAQPERDR